MKRVVVTMIGPEIEAEIGDTELGIISFDELVQLVTRLLSGAEDFELLVRHYWPDEE